MARVNSKKNKKTIKVKMVSVPRGLTAPTSVGSVQVRRDPVLKNVGNAVVVQNCERFSDVGTSATAGNYADAVLPMIPTLFTWLGGVALNYTKYAWESLEVFYIPQCSTTVNGLVGMAFLYDARDGPITSMNTLSTLSNAVLNPPWAGYEGVSMLSAGRVHPNAIMTRPDPKIYREDKPIITYSTFTTLSPADQLIYTSCYLDTATANSTSLSTVVGGLYAKYRVRLSNPIRSSVNN